MVLVKHLYFLSEVAQSFHSLDVYELERVQDGSLILMFRCKKSRLAHWPAVIIRCLLVQFTQQIETLLGRLGSVGLALDIGCVNLVLHLVRVVLLNHIFLNIINFLLVLPQLLLEKLLGTLATFFSLFLEFLELRQYHYIVLNRLRLGPVLRWLTSWFIRLLSFVLLQFLSFLVWKPFYFRFMSWHLILGVEKFSYLFYTKNIIEDKVFYSENVQII